MPKLKVGAYQFAGSDSISTNCASLLRGIRKAAKSNVRLLATQECALTGYAGVDIASPSDIDKQELRKATATLAAAARQHKLYLSLGTTHFASGKAYNTLQLIGPDGRTRGRQLKRAAYGDDSIHYATGRKGKTYQIGGFRTGLRICFEFRFPEYFRELLRAKAQLAIMGFSMVGPDSRKMPVAKAHLMSRAAENGIWIVSANSLSAVQNAPTCVVNPDGDVIREAPHNREALITSEIYSCSSPLSKAITQQARRL